MYPRIRKIVSIAIIIIISGIVIKVALVSGWRCGDFVV